MFKSYAADEQHKHLINKEKTLELIGGYFGAQLPFVGAELTTEELGSLMKGYRLGLSGSFDSSQIDTYRHEVGHLMGELVQQARAKQDQLLLEQMKGVRVKMDLSLSSSRGQKTTLQDLAKGKKVIYIDFWASWCGPCMENMPKLKALAPTLEKRGVKVVAMNAEDLVTAENVRKQFNMEIDWLVEPEGSPLAMLLKVETLPRVVILSLEGEVLFNGGHTNEAGIEAALLKAGI